MVFKIIKEILVRETITVQLPKKCPHPQLEQPKKIRKSLPYRRSRSEKCDDCGKYHITPMMRKVPDYAHNDTDIYGNKKEIWRCNKCEEKSLERFMRWMRDPDMYRLL